MQAPGAPGGPGAPAQSMQSGAAGGPGAPAQSMKGEAGAPGQPGQSLKEAGAAGGPGAPAPATMAEAGAAGGPGAAKTKAEAELKAGESGPKAATASASGGPGAAKDEEELVDPDADRPNFGNAGDDESDDDEADDEGAFPAVAARAGGKVAKKKTERKPIDPAYLTVSLMGLAAVTMAGMLWLGSNILMDIWPGISGFYKAMGKDVAIEVAPKPGDGLKIAESSKRLQRIGGVETLVIRGFISNISQAPLPVPNLRLELYNEKKEIIQDAAADAPAGLLEPLGSEEFEIRLELPQLNLAKGGYAVVWEAEE